jgi:hypothetical protein
MAQVEICVDGGLTWEAAEFIDPDEPIVWHANREQWFE